MTDVAGISKLIEAVRTYKHCSCGCGQASNNDDTLAHPPPGWKFLGSGRGRATYVYTRRGRESRIVVKVPLGDFGERCNKHEHATWQCGAFRHGKDKLARCRLVWVQSVPVIVMTRVETLREPSGRVWNPVPDWAFSVDCEQVGTTPRGRIVAYDYGL